MKRVLILLTTCLTAVAAWAAPVVPAACGDSVRITATPNTGYHFVKWQKGGSDFAGNDANPLTISSVSETATYRAFFAVNVYHYQFVNWDGSELDAGTINHGETPSYSGPVPTKPATAQYSYTFDSWSPNIGPVVADNTVFTAQFTQTVNQYTITFQNYDGSVLQSSDWSYGDTPSYSGATPTKPADAENTYTFNGWNATIVPVTGEAIYVAVYTNTTNTYTISLTPGEGGTVSGNGTFTYGTSVTIKATPNECYEFVKWSDNDTNASRTFTLTGDVTLTAEFQKISYTITVESNDVGQGTVDAVKL